MVRTQVNAPGTQSHAYLWSMCAVMMSILGDTASCHGDVMVIQWMLNVVNYCVICIPTLNKTKCSVKYV